MFYRRRITLRRALEESPQKAEAFKLSRPKTKRQGQFGKPRTYESYLLMGKLAFALLATF